MAGGNNYTTLGEGLAPYAQAPDGTDDVRTPVVAGTNTAAEEQQHPKIAALQRNVDKVKGAMSRNNFIRAFLASVFGTGLSRVLGLVTLYWSVVDYE